MNPWVQTIIAVVTSIFASSGLWALVTALVQNRKAKDDALHLMVRGLAHAKIVEIGTRFIKQGWITLDDLDEFNHYLYNPYEKLGGNGYAKKIHDEVLKLPVYLDPPVENKEEKNDGGNQ